MKPHAQRGFILAFCLLMLLFESLIMSTLLRAWVAGDRAMQEITRDSQDYMALESALDSLEGMVALGYGGSACRPGGESMQAALAALAAGIGCKFTRDGKSYRFVVEDLGVFPCLRTGSNAETISHHVRLTVVPEESARRALQTRISIAETGPACTDGSETPFPEGRLNWRSLDVADTSASGVGRRQVIP